MSEVGGDKVGGTVGDDSKNAAIGKNIDQDIRESSATGNVVHVYNAPDKPGTSQRRRRRSSGPKTGGLMPQVEEELRRAINQLNTTMVKLEGTVEKNNALTVQTIDTFREQLIILRAQVVARAPVWVAYATLFILAVIAIVLTVYTVLMISQRVG